MIALSDSVPATSAVGPSVHFQQTSVASPPRPLNIEIWNRAQTLDAFIAHAEKHRDLWHTTRRLAWVDDRFVQQANGLVHTVRLLVLLEDWCGDAIHTVPVIARLIEHNPQIEMRVVQRDLHDDLMATHLTDASRSIPVVIAYDADGVEQGWWGPRPSPLQQWVMADGLEMESSVRYKAIRTWYARDRGATTVTEVLQLLMHANL